MGGGRGREREREGREFSSERNSGGWRQCEGWTQHNQQDVEQDFHWSGWLSWRGWGWGERERERERGERGRERKRV